MSARKYVFDGFTNLFGGPWAEPRNILDRLLIRPSAKTRAKGYYLRFIVAGWIRRFLKVLFILVLLKKGVYPASLYTYLAIREGSFSAIISLLVLFGAGFLIFKIVQRSLTARRIYRQSMWFVRRGALPPRELCAVPEVYNSAFAQSARDAEADADRARMNRAMGLVRPPLPPITIKKKKAAANEQPDPNPETPERRFYRGGSPFFRNDNDLGGNN